MRAVRRADHSGINYTFVSTKLWLLWDTFEGFAMARRVMNSSDARLPGLKGSDQCYAVVDHTSLDILDAVCTPLSITPTVEN
jgi:hypothetical protein